jgi:7-cyano-7-deazaguanine synthase
MTATQGGAKPRAVALLSGGLDSVVATWAAQRTHAIALALTADYGQRAAQREAQAAGAVARLLGCPHVILDLRWLGALGGNALTDHAQAIPQLATDQLDDAAVTVESARSVWVPNRNGVLLNAAGAYADAWGCQAIVVGFNIEEATTFPDNTREFMAAADGFFALSTQSHPQVISPTAALNKRQIVALGRELGAPLQHVWSCYLGGDKPCEECESCRRLARALAD